MNNSKYCAIFWPGHINICIFSHWVPLKLSRIMKSVASWQKHIFGYWWLLSVVGKCKTPHFIAPFTEKTRIELYMHVHWMYALLTFSYFCDAEECDVYCFSLRDCTDDKLQQTRANYCWVASVWIILKSAWLYYVVTMWGVATALYGWCDHCVRCVLLWKLGWERASFMVLKELHYLLYIFHFLFLPLIWNMKWEFSKHELLFYNMFFYVNYFKFCS